MRIHEQKLHEMHENTETHRELAFELAAIPQLREQSVVGVPHRRQVFMVIKSILHRLLRVLHHAPFFTHRYGEGRLVRNGGPSTSLALMTYASGGC